MPINQAQMFVSLFCCNSPKILAVELLIYDYISYVEFQISTVLKFYTLREFDLIDM